MGDLIMNLSEEQLNRFSKMSEKQLRCDEVRKLIKLNTIDDCKQYLRVMLDFYFDIIISPEGRKATSALEYERNIWFQTMFSKGCQFKSLLDGVGYHKGSNHLNPIVDPSILFTIARRVYESVIAFELLFVIPRTEDEQTILYNLFMAHGLKERLKGFDEKMYHDYPERVAQEQKEIDNCMKEIEKTKLYSSLSTDTRKKIKDAFGKKYRYVFEEDNTLKFISFERAYKTLLRIKNDLLSNLNIYSYFSLHGHPSYLALIQFKDAFNDENRADLTIMAPAATRHVLAFMSIFIIDYMNLVPEIEAIYDKLEEPRRVLIGWHERAMRIEKKFQ